LAFAWAGGWTLVMHQRPNTCLSAATNQVGHSPLPPLDRLLDPPL
jgi:hypothetical protein